MEEEIETLEETTEEVSDETTDSLNGEDVIEEVDEPTEVDDETAKLKEENEKLRESNQQLHARLKKATPPREINKSDALTKDEAVLLVKGVPDEEIELLKQLQAGARSMGNNVSLTELAEKNPAYLAVREKRLAAEKSAKASLGGSGKSIAGRETVFKSGMSTDEHKAAWLKATKDL